MTVTRSPSAAFRARPNSAMSLHRSSGSLASARPIVTSIQAGRSGRSDDGRGSWRVEMPVQHAQRIVAWKRHAARQHLEHHGAEAVDVGTRVDDRRRQLLRRGVRDRSDELVQARSGGRPTLDSLMFARPKSTSL